MKPTVVSVYRMKGLHDITSQYNTSGMVWYGMVRYGVWYGMVWYGTV